MKRLPLTIFLLYLNFSVSAQEMKKYLFEKVQAIPVKAVTTSGFYLVKGTLSENAELIQSRSDDYKIIYAVPGTTFDSETQIYRINNTWKLAPGLKPDQKKNILRVSARDENALRQIQSDFKNSVRISHRTLLIQGHTPAELMQHSEIIFISEHHDPIEESLLSFSNLALNRVVAFQAIYPDIKGNNQVISIKERGYNSQDPDIRGRSIYEWPDIGISSHATDMATIAAGSGLISAGSMGSSPEARLKQASFNSLFAENSQYYTDVSVQNHSYGTTPESFYGPEAASYDASVEANPQLIHVFSIGNAGLQTVQSGKYSGIPGFNTLTGNFKNAKNVLTVSSSDPMGGVILQNSKGPTFDGRIKPDIVAYGEGGTSDAAALVSGAIAALSELYFERFQQMPEFALMRAILIAGADEIGAAGPDYTTGYGLLNLVNSGRIIDDASFTEITSGETTSIDIPPGATNLRLVLSWLDPPSMPGDEIILMNDLDMVLTDPAGKIFLPWTRSTYAHADSLLMDARRAADHINTQELITIPDPVAGRYELKINCPSTGIPAYIAWQFENESQFVWRYPVSNSSMEAGKQTFVYWDTSFSGNARIEWSANDTDWKNLGSTNIENEYFNFIAPDTTAVISLRMVWNGSAFESPEVAVSPMPQPQVDFVCADSWQISWNPIDNISSYQVLGRNNDRLTTLATTSDLRYGMLFNDYADSLLAVQAFINGFPSQRSVTFNISQQGVGCYFAGFTGLLSSEAIDFTLRIGTTFGITRIQTTRLNDGEIIYTTTSPEISIEFSDPAPLTGTNYYQTLLTLSDGRTVSSETISFIFAPPGDALVYPNPVVSGRTLNIYSTDADIVFELLTLQGAVVSRVPLNTTLEEIPMSVSKGLYLYRIYGPGVKVISGKLVVY